MTIADMIAVYMIGDIQAVIVADEWSARLDLAIHARELLAHVERTYHVSRQAVSQ